MMTSTGRELRDRYENRVRDNPSILMIVNIFEKLRNAEGMEYSFVSVLYPLHFNHP